MSAKNKHLDKVRRRSERRRRKTFDRTPVSKSVSRQIATKVLANPEYKASAKIRRKLETLRGVIVEVPRRDPTHPAVKLALRLQKLPLAVLYRRLKQSARRASTCKHLLSELSKDSHFAPPIIAQHTHQLGMHKQIKAEIFSRRQG